MGDSAWARIAAALARRRVPLGFVFGVAALWLARPSGGSLAAGAPVALLGEGLRLWAAGHLNKSQEVTSSGPYRWMAHPLYVGSSLMAVGLAIAASSIAVAGLVAIYMGATIVAAIRSEESFLRTRFSEDYDRYRRGRGQRAADEGRRFSLARARANHEVRAILGLAVALLLLAWKATYNDSFWRTAGTVSWPGG